MNVPSLLRLRRPMVAAHRGDCRLAPENTLPAFSQAVALRVDMVEFDCQESADGALVVIHDDRLDRTTNAAKLWKAKRITVASKTAAELSRLDAGSWFSPRFAKANIPTLDATLKVILPRAVALIERKSGPVEAYVEALARYGRANRVILQSFDYKFLADFHERAPEVMLAVLGDQEITSQVLSQIVRSGASMIAWDHRRLNEETIRLIHRRKLKALAWAVDTATLMRRLLSWGLDGVVTNTPGKAMQTLAGN